MDTIVLNSIYSLDKNGENASEEHIRGQYMSRTLNPQLFGTNESSVIKVDASAVTGKKIREVENSVEVLQQKLDRLAQMFEGKYQHLMGTQKNMEMQMRQIVDTFSKQNAQLASRLSEKINSETKIQGLIDRHQQLVANFEVRLGQIQKVAAEQDMKIMSYQATYEEVLREIRKISN